MKHACPALRVPCVGRVSTRHGRLKSALRQAILVACGRYFTVTSMFNKDTPKHETRVPCVTRALRYACPA